MAANWPIEFYLFSFRQNVSDLFEFSGGGMKRIKLSDVQLNEGRTLRRRAANLFGMNKINE